MGSMSTTCLPPCFYKMVKLKIGYLIFFICEFYSNNVKTPLRDFYSEWIPKFLKIITMVLKLDPISEFNQF